MGKKSKSNPYSVHPGVEMVQGWIATLKDKTGRTLEEWVALGKSKGPKDIKSLRTWFKSEFHLGTNTAWWLADRVLENDEGLADSDPDHYLAMSVKYVDGQYTGAKQSLRPLYDQLLALSLSIAKDAKACPCKTIVPIYRNHVIAQIKPTTRTRIDFGLALAKHKGKLPARVIDTGGAAKKDRITHRIEITKPEDIDATVKKWLQVAYDLDV